MYVWLSKLSCSCTILMSTGLRLEIIYSSKWQCWTKQAWYTTFLFSFSCWWQTISSPSSWECYYFGCGMWYWKGKLICKLPRLQYHNGKFQLINSDWHLTKWAIEVAQEYPNTIVQGVDLSPIQPVEIPGNCSFRVQNVETEWDTEEQFDFIHSRAMFIAFTDWSQFIKNCYK